MNDADPLADADVGATVTIEHTEEIWLGQLESEHASGTDRFADRRVSNVEVVTDEYGEQYLAVTVDSDVTKRLPYRWDESAAPRTETERQQARRTKWKRRVATIGVNLTVVGIGLAIGVRVMNSMAGELVVNGEPLPPVGWLPVATVFMVALAIVAGIQYLPRPGPGVGR